MSEINASWRERGSAFLDGELSEHEVHQLIRDLEQDPSRMQILQTYMQISESLRGQADASGAGPVTSEQRASAAPSARLSRGLRQWLGQGAIAASVLLGVVGFTTLFNGEQLGPQPMVATGEPRLLAPEAAGQADASLAGFEGPLLPAGDAQSAQPSLDEKSLVSPVDKPTPALIP